MQWIDEFDLKSWSGRTDARELLADMVADLIRATITDATRFRFPGGDASQLRGWDGFLETTTEVSFVPGGKSKWEFGVGGGANKASSDYNTRTNQTDLHVMRENTLVLVNLQKWDTPREMLTRWEDDRKAEGKWRDVRYLDAVELVHWLNEHPAVAALYARQVLQKAPKDGALSTDEFWEMYSLQFDPQLREEVLVADRQDVADGLLQKMVGPAQSIMLGAETSEEVVAFAVAAIRLAKADMRRSIEVRTLIIETENAARFLSQRSNMAFITISGADQLAGALAQRAPTLSAVTGTQARRPETVFLRRPTASAMSEGLAAMGIDRQSGYELAHRCGRSVTILRRLIPRGPFPHPAWEPMASVLKPAFLAGGWSANSQLDQQILVDLSGLPDYAALENKLFPTLTLPDPPLDHLREFWQVRAPVDAFSIYGQMVSERDLKQLRDAVIRVFSHIVKPPSREEKFSLTYTPPADYSKWLRDGLALTLLIIATMHKVGGLQINNMTPQRYVDDVLSALPDFGKTHETLIALGDQTAILAEAAPSPFLKALECILEGERDEAAKLFVVAEDPVFGGGSPHVEVLWALEALAWNSQYLNRVAIVLAKLADLDPDPDSRFINRPINSLRAILLSWKPNTHAPLAQRISCLDLILAAYPNVGWQLLIKLMPRSHDTCSPTRTPRLRDASPMIPENITYGIVWDFEAAIAERTMQAAADDEGRIVVLVKQMASFQPDTRAKILAFIDGALSRFQLHTGSPIWHALREEVTRHEYYSDSDWAMPESERETINRIVERHRPRDPLASEKQFFDDWMVHVGQFAERGEDQSEKVRAEALQRVLAREGVAGIVRLSRMVRVPSLIGQALRQVSVTKDQLFELLISSIDGEAPGDLAFYVSAIGAERFGAHWGEEFRRHVIAHSHNARATAGLVLGWPLNRSTWDFVKALGDDVYDEYWRRLSVLPTSGPIEELLFAIEEFRRVGRDLEALCLAQLRIGDLSPELILRLLEGGQRQLASGQAKMSTMLSFYLNRAFLALQASGKVNEEDIAKQEYAYLPLLIHEDRPLVIHSILARDPALFVEVLSHVFRGKNAPSDVSPTEGERARAEISYRLLSSFKTVPGLNGQLIDAGVLNTWVDRVRNQAMVADLSEIADQYIGQILAHAPTDSGELFWPPSPVCAVIERLASTDIEAGFRLECFNKRGATSRGMFEGGNLERADASTYAEWSVAAVRYPRTAAVLSAIADTWRNQAEEEDVSAELRKMER